MTQADTPTVEAYLKELAARLPEHGASRELLDEARDHLLESTAVYERAGAARAAAEQQAVAEFGAVAQLAADFGAVAAVGEVRRQTRAQLIFLLLLTGMGVGVFVVAPLLRGQFVDLVLHPLTGKVAAATILGPALVLRGLSQQPQAWEQGEWLRWLVRMRKLANWLFVPGVSVCVALLAVQAGVVVGAPHAWVAAASVASGLCGGVLAGHLVVGTPGAGRHRHPGHGGALAWRLS